MAEEIIIVKGSELGKDPAVSWIFNDWQGGTAVLSRHLKGCYMDLLVAQFNNGCLTLEEIKTVLASDFGSSWSALQKKFRKISAQDKSVSVLCPDSSGRLIPFEFVSDSVYLNVRLNFETIKRKKFNKSRRDNLSPDEGDSSPHMGNGNGIGNEILKRKGVFLESLNPFKVKYGEELIKSFFEYWTEHKPNGKKMRFEMQAVFDISRRLSTWAKNEEQWNNNVKGNGRTIQMGFPDHYDRAFESKLSDGKQLSKYWQHLHAKGYKPKKTHAGDIIDWIKAEVA